MGCGFWPALREWAELSSFCYFAELESEGPGSAQSQKGARTPLYCLVAAPDEWLARTGCEMTVWAGQGWGHCCSLADGARALDRVRRRTSVLDTAPIQTSRQG